MSNAQEMIKINVLAYNEELYIEQCLQSIEQALSNVSPIQAKVSIICNGCNDATFTKAADFCQKKNDWQAFELAMGDKANAWNFAIKQDNNASLTLFIDGDCQITPQSILALINTYQANRNSYIIAAVPKTQGRSYQQTITNTLKGEALSGNFYVLTPAFLDKIKKSGFLLPIGLIGDDSLLAWIASHDFALSNGVIPNLLIGCKDAQFDYHRLTPTSVNNILLYLRRLARYSLRHLQQHAIREHLNLHDDFASLPKDITLLYSKVKISHLRRSFVHPFFDLSNFFKMKRMAKMRME